MVRPSVSEWVGGLRIGADFFARRGALSEGVSPRGVVDRIADLANPGLDLPLVHPDVVAFFDDTAGLDLVIRSRWRFPFSLAWRVARPFMRLIGQFVLPVRDAAIVTRAFAFADGRDGRPSARAVVRTYRGTEQVMQVVAYATWTEGEARYMSAAFPMPAGHVLGILRLDGLGGAGEPATRGVALTSRRRAGDTAGVWFALGALVFRTPFGERLELWPPGAPGAPALDPETLPRATIFGKHEQTFAGVRLVTHDYWFRRREE